MTALSPTEEKVTKHILNTLLKQGDNDIQGATISASWEALQKAKDLGWGEKAQIGMIRTYLSIGADLYLIQDQLLAASSPRKEVKS